MKIMKKIIILWLLSIPGMLSAQHILQSDLNMFRSDDVLTKQQVNYKDPGRTGADVLWDFSQLEIENDEYELFYSSYDNDTTITGMEHLTRYHYGLQNDSLLLWGFDNQTTQLFNRQPELLLKFPVHYGDTVGSYFYGHGKYGNRLELDAMGSIETAADAYGIMILPNKDTLKHVLRTHTLKYLIEDTRRISEEYYYKDTTDYRPAIDSIETRLTADSVILVVETFRWYEKGYRYPVFETVRSWEQYRGQAVNEDYEFLATAFFYPPQEHYYLEDDEDNLALLEETDTAGIIDPWDGLTYNLYPNPVRNTPLEVEMYLPKAANIRLQLRSSMGLVAVDENKGYQTEGVVHFQLNTFFLPVGNYILDIWLDDHLINEIILKR
jgi:hypothetical protein